MRKYLLSTSAIVGAAFLSSAALADVSITATTEWEMVSGDTDNSATDGTYTTINNEVQFSFTNKTDSGLNISFNVDMDGDAGGLNDESWLTIEGGFGKLMLGQKDGVEDQMAISADSLVAEEHGMSGTLNTTYNTIMTATGSQLDGNVNKLTYLLPSMGGLSAGASFQDSGYATSTDTTAFGLTYAMEASGAAITLAYTTATTEAATQDSDATTIGAQVVVNGITFVANQASLETVGEDQTGNSFGASYTLPSGITLAATTMKAEDDRTEELGEEYSVNHYELTYPVASGLSAVIAVSDYDYKVGTGSEASSKTADSGTISSLMLKASF